MLKAAQKKRENISEYIIYMYQTEDLLRTYKFDLNKITKFIISSLPINDTEKKELVLWYASLIERMRLQKIEKSGHLKEIKELFNSLHNFHKQLKKTNKTYLNLTIAANAFIIQQIKLSKSSIKNPIQIAINAIYGFLLLKINGKNMNCEQKKMLIKFGDMLSYLSYSYKKHLAKTENLDYKNLTS